MEACEMRGDWRWGGRDERRVEDEGGLEMGGREMRGEWK